MYEIVFDGFEADKPEKTYYVGNYYEHKIVGIKSPPDQLNAVTAEYMLYFPIVHQERETVVTSYYYADGERIAMKSDGIVYYLFSDHLGSTTSVVARDTGEEISHQLYHPWGTTRYSYNSSGEKITDYGYTGQMQVDDIYYYNARWYDPMLGRFMQADTLVPSHQGTQGFDRYAYINNNPVNGTDPTGMWMCDIYDISCAEEGDLNVVVFIGGWDNIDQSDDNPLMPSIQNNPGTLYYNYDAKDKTVDKQELANFIIRDLGLNAEGKYRSISIVGHSAGGDVGLFAMEEVASTPIRRLALLDPAMKTTQLGYSEMFDRLDILYNSGVDIMFLYGPSPDDFLDKASKRSYSQWIDAVHDTYYNNSEVLNKTNQFVWLGIR